MKKQNEKRDAAKAADGAAASKTRKDAVRKTYFHKLPGGAAVIVHHTAKPPRIEGKAARGRYAGMTDAQVAEQAEILMRATKKIVTGALKFAAVEIGTMLAQVTRNDGADVRFAHRVGEADYMARELLAKWQNELDLLA